MVYRHLESRRLCQRPSSGFLCRHPPRVANGRARCGQQRHKNAVSEGTFCLGCMCDPLREALSKHIADRQIRGGRQFRAKKACVQFGPIRLKRIGSGEFTRLPLSFENFVPIAPVGRRQ